MRLLDLSEGKPALWKSGIYGDVAVHVAGMHNGVVRVTVDGGESARQVIDHPELLDGWFVVPERLHKRASKARKTGVGRVEVPAEVTNTIRDVPGVGRVAIITDDRPKTTAQRKNSTPKGQTARRMTQIAVEAGLIPAQRNKRRLSLASALKEAAAMRSGARTTLDADFVLNWPAADDISLVRKTETFPSAVEEF